MNLEAFDVLVRMTLIGSAAVLLVLLTRRFLRRHFGAQLAYAAWLLVPASIFAMALPAPQQPVSRLLEIVRVAPAAIAAPAQASTHAIDFRLVLLFLWLAGVMLAAALFVRQQRRYLRSLGLLHARDSTYIVQSDSEFAGPALIGAWRPRIVLPVDFDLRYDARERELILAHEQIHRARGDAWANAFAVALRALNWFNPLLHYASVKFRIDQELACDAVVVARFPEARRHYADAMLKVQLAGQLRQELQLPVGCRWPSDQFLKERILMLKQSRPSRAARRFGLCLVVTMTLGFAWGAWASQSSRPPTAPAAGRSVDATLRLDVDGRQGRPIRIVHALGSEFEVADGNWRAAMTANATVDGDIALDATLRRDGRVVSTPGIVARSGEPFAIAVDGTGHDAFRVEGQLALTNAAPPPPPAPPGVPPPPPRAAPLPPAPPAAPALAAPAPPAPPTPTAPSLAAPAPPAPPPPPPAPDRRSQSGDQSVQFRTMRPPAYPEAALKSRTEGTVYVRVSVGVDGKVSAAKVDHVFPESAAGVLGDSAVAAVKTWTFEPARSHGKAVASDVLVPIDFAMHEKSESPAPEKGALDAITIRGDLKH